MLENNTKLIYDTLGIVMHRRCNASYKICCMQSNPDCKEELNTESIKRFLNSVEDKQIEYVSYTGGEPFLEYEKLKDLISFTTSLGKKASCVTNGFWANNYKDTYNKLSELKSAGLYRINISYDAYHKEFISPKNISNILRACSDLKIISLLATIKLKNEKVGEAFDLLGNSLNNVNIKIVQGVSVGNAKKNYDTSKFERKLKPENIKCVYDGIITISYDGNIYPCCSFYVFDTALIVGNYETRACCH